MLDLSPRARTDNPGYRRMFRPGALTLGTFFPIEAFRGDRPTMDAQPELARLAEQSGFAALWFRDVPLRDPSFGDVGQVFDPWVYLGYIAAHTSTIALATGAIVLPLRHPVHTAKAAASVDQLSGGRLVLGVASGDRSSEFPAFNVVPESRGQLFREHLRVFSALLRETFPRVSSPLGEIVGLDLVPKPRADGLPLLVVGNSQQAPDWIAAHADGWVMYPRAPELQQQVVARWVDSGQRLQPGRFLPFSQSLYLDLDANPDHPPEPIHLGYRIGRRPLLQLLETLEAIGVNHVALNLKYGRRSARVVLEDLAAHILPRFPALYPQRHGATA